eukprot:TRINITY_DN36941_c0_g1_i1.p1 TRINITY_DN36941_c0_g1~~TRINITY_DN36941_c0_g1_i1.p1  ORF type:complete len:1718 (-),score=509.89 TRINITY_DN36941_c0_g1_i1:56-5209(-)
MQLYVSVTDAKNLSQSVLITRHLVADLQIGESRHASTHLLQDNVLFVLSALDAPLQLCIRNSQTQTVMYERSIPLGALSSQKEWSEWIAVLTPDEARRAPFEERVPPRPNEPQVLLSLRYVLDSGSRGSRAATQVAGAEQTVVHEDDMEALQNAFSKLEQELQVNRNRQQARTPSMLADRPSLLDREAAAIQEKERELNQIKSRLTAMTHAKRQASSAQEQLQEVSHEIGRLKEQLRSAEEELNHIASRKSDTEEAILRLVTAVEEAKEMLQQRDLSIQELRHNRDETEQQLSRTLKERETWQASANAAQEDFDTEAKHASAELDGLKSEAQELSEALDQCDRDHEELLSNKAAQEAEDARNFMAGLQKELDAAMAEFQALGMQKEKERVSLSAAEELCHDAELRLEEAESAANAARSELQEASAEARDATEGVKRELADKLARAAQLEGSLGENRNQLKEMRQRADALMQELLDHTSAAVDRDSVLAVLEQQLEAQEKALEQARSAKAELRSAAESEQRKAQECQQRHATLKEGSTNGLQDQSDMLATTRRVVDKELSSTVTHVAKLGQDQKQLDAEVAEASAAAEESEQSRLKAISHIETLEAELRAAKLSKAERQEALNSHMSRVSALDQDIAVARKELQSASAAAIKLQSEAADKAAATNEKEEALRNRLADLKAELEVQQQQLGQHGTTQGALLDTLAETRRQMPLTQEEAAEARRERDELQRVASDLRRSLEAAQALAADQVSEAASVVSQVAKQREELDEYREDAARHEENSQALRTSLSKQLASHLGRSDVLKSSLAASKNREMRISEQLSELRVQRAELTMKEESVAADNCIAKERLSQLRSDIDETRQASAKKLQAAKKELAAQETATSLEARLAQLGKELAIAKEKAAVARGGGSGNGSLAKVQLALVKRREENSALQKRLEDCRAQEEELLWQLGRGGSSSSSAPSKSDEVARLRKKKEELEGQVGSSSQVQLQGEIVVLTQQVRSLESAKEDMTLKLREMRQSMLDATAQQASLKDEFSQLTAQVEAARRASHAARIDLEKLEQEQPAGSSPQKRRSMFDPTSPSYSGAATEEVGPGSEERMLELLEEERRDRAEAVKQASDEALSVERDLQDLRHERRTLEEELNKERSLVKESADVENTQLKELRDLEKSVQLCEDESDLLTLGLQEADHRKDFIMQEQELLQLQAGRRYTGTLRQFAEEVQQLRVAAQVQIYKDEQAYWRQAAEELETALGQLGASSHQLAAEEPLRQKVTALEAQLASKEQQLRELEQQSRPDGVPGNVRSVPSALHGLLTPPSDLGAKEQRRALVIGCNYSASYAPLYGCANDAWNVQCLLRQSLQYAESQVRCLVDCSCASPSPPSRQPTRDNILSGIQWLTANAKPGDSLLFYFSGYGAQQPQSHIDGLYEGHLVPMDFADDLPQDFKENLRSNSSSSSQQLSLESVQRAVSAGGYRLVPMSMLTDALHALPASCKATLVLDCCQPSVVPLVRQPDPESARSDQILAGPGPPLFAKLPVARGAGDIPNESFNGVQARLRLLDLPPLPGRLESRKQPSKSTPISPSSAPSPVTRPAVPSLGVMGSPTAPVIVPNMADSMPESPRAVVKKPGNTGRSGSGPACKSYCYASCQNEQACCELPIEGLVQGAATWAFVKAVTACHLSMSVSKHSKAMDGVLQNLRRKYRWIQQTPVIQLSATGNLEDRLILS